MDSENRNTFKKKKTFKKISGRGLSLATVDAECRKRTEQMLWTLDRVSSAGRDEWKHLNTDSARVYIFRKLLQNILQHLLEKMHYSTHP